MKTPTSQKVLNAAEAGEYLGYAKSYIYRLTCTGKIPFSKPNGKLYFDKEKLDSWMLSNAKNQPNPS